ncbi:hypothetical protein SNE35_31700 [Paucibacter sp. R3-3]|uniref:Uncharacterized protein n=1 Tax=Roseateles agri TaxID=3098619 RepID=A0ABU5DS09_9BURK|nr:hypothetical protein [Paucibacter sp. R3-3]MDY0749104.1 hypothetical protein [Paucibacter sp. R3-3]
MKTVSRQPHWLFLAAFALCLSAVVGGSALGAYLKDGGVIVLTCFAAGGVVALSLWWWTMDEAGKGAVHTLVRLSLAIIGGLAFYANLTYGLWAAKVPLKLRIIDEGRMAEHFWLGPATLVYAVFCWLVLRYRARDGK